MNPATATLQQRGKAMFLLFAGDDYYPAGGAEDFQGAYESVEAAQTAHNPDVFYYKGGWANILDLNTLSIVMTFYHGKWEQADQD